MLRILPLILLTTLALSAAPVWQPDKNETVVVLGDTFFERDYRHGHLETILTQATADKKMRVRNLGWSGDTPRCESRSYFGPPAEGFSRLSKQLAEIKPTTVICCYGAVDAFEGERGVAPFIDSYKKLLEMIQSTTGAKIVLMTPPATSRDGKRYPSLAGHNKERKRYADAIQRLAAEQSLALADLFSLMNQRDWQTVNGVTFTEEDYATIAPLFVQSLGLSIPQNKVSTEIREIIIAKNHLFFQRWRPQNEIYLFGSRKHEQGRNGAEIPQFDPLVAEKEQQLFTALAQP